MLHYVNPPTRPTLIYQGVGVSLTLTQRAIQAVVIRIGQQAEFTPKEVSVKSDRIQRMYAVHLKPVTPNSYLKLGIPAIGVISTDGKGLPKNSGILGDL
jgi:HlyD family secretion protein